MKNYVREIGAKTAGMSAKDRVSYVFAYYWYHMLGFIAGIGLSLFLILHSAVVLTGAERPEFTCVLVNQEINPERDKEIGRSFAEAAGKNAEKITVDSDYNISYGSIKLEGANESSYEKFFFRWRNEELDAVILPESFYEYIKSLGGTCSDLGGFETGGLPLYEDEGTAAAVLIEETEIRELLVNETGERLLLIFPQNSGHREACQEFLYFLEGKAAE